MPVDPKLVYDFDPNSVPTVGKLIRELNEAAAAQAASPSAEGSQEDIKREAVGAWSYGADGLISPHRMLTADARLLLTDWRQTSLKPYVDMLDQHCAGLMRQTREKKRGQSLVRRGLRP